MSENPALRLRGVDKSFGPVHVLSDVDLTAEAGEVTALVGDNGAGKTTLIKCIGGIHKVDAGEFLIDGRQATVRDPRDAAALGIEIVYQDLALCENLDIVENMFLGRERRTRLGTLDENTMEKLARQTLASLSVRTVRSVRQGVASLSGGQRQTVAIAKSVLWKSTIVILDEPTAALGVAQTEQVLHLVRRLADQNVAVILVSHNMNDVLRVADSIAVLYLGRLAAQVRRADVTQTRVVELITAGRSGDLGLSPAESSGSDDMSTQTHEIIEQNEREPHAEPEGLPALSTYARSYVARVRGGQLGSIPALTGLIVISAVFAVVHPGFLSAYNIEALVIQAAPIIIMAMGLIFVLLLGEIDLSAGTTGGLCAAIMAVLLLRHGAPWWAGVAAALVTGVAIGLAMGWLRARIGIPSFVITLATFLAFQGVTLILIGGQGSVILPDTSPLIGLENSFIPLWAGWTLLAAVVAAYAAIKINDAAGRRRADLPRTPPSVIAVKVLTLAAVGALFTYVMGVNRNLTTNAFFDNRAQGMPWVVLLLVGLFASWHFVLSRTRYGRHLYAVGGNEEGARRAGIRVSRVRISVFAICSGMAAVSGIAAASLLQSVQSNAGAGNTLLLAVGAAVIGGTSLFGGHGRMIDAVLGGLVVAVIINGMSDLIQGSNSAGYEYVVTGAVLLLAAGFDAVVRRRGQTG